MVESDIKFYTVPIIINITLYKNNYVDNVIIGELSRGAYRLQIPSDTDSFSVSADEFRKIISKKFKDKVDKMEDYSKEVLPQNISSAYFIINMLNRFRNLQIINIHVSNNRRYSRVFKVNNEQTVIGFDYKITQGILDYPLFLGKSALNRFNILLKRINLDITENITLDPYYIIKAQDYVNKIAKLENDDKVFFDENYDIIELTYEFIEPKIESDNTYLIIKTDFYI